MKIYIAGKFSSQGRLRIMREKVQELGHGVTSSWLDQKATGSIRTKREYVDQDLKDICLSRLLILDTLDVSETGGREVELGYALGKHLETWRVGKQRNVFHLIVDRTFKTWKDALIALSQRS